MRAAVAAHLLAAPAEPVADFLVACAARLDADGLERLSDGPLSDVVTARPEDVVRLRALCRERDVRLLDLDGWDAPWGAEGRGPDALVAATYWRVVRTRRHLGHVARSLARPPEVLDPVRSSLRSGVTGSESRGDDGDETRGSPLPVAPEHPGWRQAGPLEERVVADLVSHAEVVAEQDADALRELLGRRPFAHLRRTGRVDVRHDGRLPLRAWQRALVAGLLPARMTSWAVSTTTRGAQVPVALAPLLHARARTGAVDVVTPDGRDELGETTALADVVRWTEFREGQVVFLPPGQQPGWAVCVGAAGRVLLELAPSSR